MSDAWPFEFFQRMQGFQRMHPSNPDDIAVSIKIRVTAGCFHREHSPHAYRLIDEHLRKLSQTEATFSLVEHESGPEVLVYVAVATAGITLTKSVIDLVIAILNARTASVKRGDRPSQPVELIVRRSIDGTRTEEEIVLRMAHTDEISHTTLEERLLTALERVVRQENT